METQKEGNGQMMLDRRTFLNESERMKSRSPEREIILKTASRILTWSCEGDAVGNLEHLEPKL